MLGPGTGRHGQRVKAFPRDVEPVIRAMCANPRDDDLHLQRDRGSEARGHRSTDMEPANVQRLHAIDMIVIVVVCCTQDAGIAQSAKSSQLFSPAQVSCSWRWLAMLGNSRLEEFFLRVWCTWCR